MEKKEYQSEIDEENDDYEFDEELSNLTKEESENNDFNKLKKYINGLYTEQENKKQEKSS